MKREGLKNFENIVQWTLDGYTTMLMSVRHAFNETRDCISIAAMQMVPESMSSILLIKVKLTKPFVKVKWPLKGKNRLELEY